MKSLKLCGVQSSNGLRHSGGSANATRVDGTHTKVIRVSLKQALHRIFADLSRGVVTLHPVLCSNFTSAQQEWKEKHEQQQIWTVNKIILSLLPHCSERLKITVHYVLRRWFELRSIHTVHNCRSMHHLVWLPSDKCKFQLDTSAAQSDREQTNHSL